MCVKLCCSIWPYKAVVLFLLYHRASVKFTHTQSDRGREEEEKFNLLLEHTHKHVSKTADRRDRGFVNIQLYRALCCIVASILAAPSLTLIYKHCTPWVTGGYFPNKAKERETQSFYLFWSVTLCKALDQSHKTNPWLNEVCCTEVHTLVVLYH